jgi:hypothetical protein
MYRIVGTCIVYIQVMHVYTSCDRGGGMGGQQLGSSGVHLYGDDLLSTYRRAAALLLGGAKCKKIRWLVAKKEWGATCAES